MEKSPNLMHFPVVMQDAFQKYHLCFPEGTQFCYHLLPAYRIIKRERGKSLVVTRDDFRSMAELGTRPRRGQHLEQNPLYYGTSLFSDAEEAKYRFHLPRYPKKLVKGFVVDRCGPKLGPSKGGSSHLTWWLYDDADIELGKFEVIEDEE